MKTMLGTLLTLGLGFAQDMTTADASGAISSDEFSQGLFGNLDSDADAALAEAEYDPGTGLWGDADAAPAFADLDADASGDLSQDEFAQGYDAASLFTSFGADANEGQRG